MAFIYMSVSIGVCITHILFFILFWHRDELLSDFIFWFSKHFRGKIISFLKGVFPFFFSLFVTGAVGSGWLFSPTLSHFSLTDA